MSAFDVMVSHMQAQTYAIHDYNQDYKNANPSGGEGTIAPLQPGHYTLSAWVKSSGGPARAFMRLSGHEGTGSTQVIFRAAGQGGTWVDTDDVALTIGGWTTSRSNLSTSSTIGPRSVKSAGSHGRQPTLAP